MLQPSTTKLGSRTRGLGRKAARAREIVERSGEVAYHLPGKVPIAHVRKLVAMAGAPQGATMPSRFMVRGQGHWRRALESWKDRRLRWIERYWKGPDMATIVEREYRLKR